MTISFTEHIFWGVGYLCLPIVGALLFIMMKWHRKSVRISVFLQVAGFILLVGSAIATIMQNWSVQKAIARFLPQPYLFARVTQVTVSDTANTKPPTTLEPVQPDEPTISLKAYTSRSQFRQYMEVGYHAFDVKDYHTALINFQQAVEAQPNNPYALKAIENTIEKFGDRSYTDWMNSGYQAFDKKHYAIARQYFQNALQERPRDRYALQAIENVELATRSN
ncbi:tetratricopeptide repeat protein [Roseofilum casamattae]|uniref:Tetratricopeptide repeat protein n=1 Tax=Roseofilum casamattae BLCC-M143 TaxID=3022442 RepID=A0ABT7C1A2_9CYAN|nr:hypothetical protein [Roseofilum casamattae]MDJ1185238.1 hypothetical protein [Roseofilum casamattae BLCC-M143]